MAWDLKTVVLCCVVFFGDQGASFVNLVGRMPEKRKSSFEFGNKTAAV